MGSVTPKRADRPSTTAASAGASNRPSRRANRCQQAPLTAWQTCPSRHGLWPSLLQRLRRLPLMLSARQQLPPSRRIAGIEPALANGERDDADHWRFPARMALNKRARGADDLGTAGSHPPRSRVLPDRLFWKNPGAAGRLCGSADLVGSRTTLRGDRDWPLLPVQRGEGPGRGMRGSAKSRQAGTAPHLPAGISP